MKCLTNDQIQQLMDGETSSFVSDKYQQHLAACSSCRERFEDQKALARSVKDSINDFVPPIGRIPEFVIPTKIIQPTLKSRSIPGWLKVAALLIPVFFVWKMTYRPNKPTVDFKPTSENIRLYEMSHEVDANTAFQQNMIITTVADEKGKVIECSAD